MANSAFPIGPVARVLFVVFTGLILGAAAFLPLEGRPVNRQNHHSRAAGEKGIASEQAPLLVQLPKRSVIRPVLDCTALASRDFSGIAGAPTRIESARTVPGAKGMPPVCTVRGYVAPQVQFELRLPIEDYTGRYLQVGCGGNCGGIQFFLAPACDSPLAMAGSFALGANDSGHHGAGFGDGLWAYNDPQLRIDFGYRADHVAALASKQIIRAYYGQEAAYSYFDGCSDGGREGLEEAERYPGDFDGIVAGSPAILIAEAMERFLWESQKSVDAQGKTIFTPEKLALLHHAAIAACDKLDGLADGEIDDPRACHYDPGALECPGDEDRPSCLTAGQVKAAREFYQGPVDAQGQALYPGGEPYGSELLWIGPYSFSAQGGALANDFVRYMVYGANAPSNFSWRNWKFDRKGLEILESAAPIYDAKNPDLSGFRSHGGKLILWQGWADNAAGAYGTLAYYQAVQNSMGGLEAVERFARVFMIPGVYHCAGGYIPYQADMLGPLVSWVEKGQSPRELMASATLADGEVRTRPLFPYPMRAKYKGSGNINDASNFAGVMPRVLPDDSYHWLGSLATPHPSR